MASLCSKLEAPRQGNITFAQHTLYGGTKKEVGRAYLLKGHDEGLELARCVFHEKELSQDAVKCGPIASIGRVIQEWKLIGCVMLQHEADGVQLQQQLPAGVALSQILE